MNTRSLHTVGNRRWEPVMTSDCPKPLSPSPRPSPQGEGGPFGRIRKSQVALKFKPEALRQTVCLERIKLQRARKSILPLPKGEGRGEGEGSVLFQERLQTPMLQQKTSFSHTAPSARKEN